MSYFEFPHTRTYDTDLGWLIKTVKCIIEELDAIEQWKDEHEDEFSELIELYNQLISGNFPPEVEEAFNRWMIKNAYNIIGELATLVWFGINDDGYWVAYIPESWEDIVFQTTGLDINIVGVDYGHLVLSMKAGGN